MLQVLADTVVNNTSENRKWWASGELRYIKNTEW